jgi:small GTP-binding protein
MKKLIVGILAHVDAGKTSLSESMLFLSGKIRRMGRVDNKDAYLDTNELERMRGITIFSKQAIFQIGDTEVTLMDTPGHVDFSTEMERTLQILDYAILVVSGADGVQGHTKTLWRLLAYYHIPVFIFVNKMDQSGTDSEKLIKQLKRELGDGCICFTDGLSEQVYDQIALTDETVMNAYLESGRINHEVIQGLIQNRNVFPVYFGSALKQVGINGFMDGLSTYTTEAKYPEHFGAKVFKISRDAQGNRLTHMKITGGVLNVRDVIQAANWEEKVTQIRMYSADKFEAVGSAAAGTVCAVTGLTLTKAGEGVGIEMDSNAPQLESVLSYKLILPEGVDERLLMPKLRQLEEEDPELQLVWNEVLKEINVQIMGEVQIEVLQALIQERFNVSVTFGEGRIVYKETIENICEGVGHFEPLRHYAEVHLLLEPSERGSGLQFETNCGEDVLEKNWQRLILNHLREKNHLGVLTGSHITDMKITLVAGRAHNRHTEGGDFREATFRALRQGLKQAKSVLLEPYYSFRLELPTSLVGRAMADVDQMKGTCEIALTEGDVTVLTGEAPMATMRNYHMEVIAYSKGYGRLFTSLKGYGLCHNADEVIATMGYDSERDVENPTGSIFCKQGSGFLVPWYEVKDHMHVESYLKPVKSVLSESSNSEKNYDVTESISLEEIDQIMNSTFYANQGKKTVWKKKKSAVTDYYSALSSSAPIKPRPTGDEYLLVDGYNIIFAWEDLKTLAQTDFEAARIKLLDLLCNYQGIQKSKIIVVFDAYRVAGGREKVEAYHNIHVVFTGEAQTADQYIEKFAHKNNQKYQMTVATSDGLQQVIIRGAGCNLISAREFEADVKQALIQMRQDHLESQTVERSKLEESLSEEAREKLKRFY